MKWYKIGLLARLQAALFGARCSNDGENLRMVRSDHRVFQQKRKRNDQNLGRNRARDFERKIPRSGRCRCINAGECWRHVSSQEMCQMWSIFTHSPSNCRNGQAGVFEDLSNKDYLKREKHLHAEKYAVNGKVYNVLLNGSNTESTTTKDKEFRIGLEEFRNLGQEFEDSW